MRSYEDGQFTYQAGEVVAMGHFFEKVTKQGDYIIDRDFMLKYISCQYIHLVIVVRISLMEIKVKAGEPKRLKVTDFDYEHIMDTFFHITLWPYE